MILDDQLDGSTVDSIRVKSLFADKRQMGPENVNRNVAISS